MRPPATVFSMMVLEKIAYTISTGTVAIIMAAEQLGPVGGVGLLLHQVIDAYGQGHFAFVLQEHIRVEIIVPDIDALDDGHGDVPGRAWGSMMRKNTCASDAPSTKPASA